MTRNHELHSLLLRFVTWCVCFVRFRLGRVGRKQVENDEQNRQCDIVRRLFAIQDCIDIHAFFAISNHQLTELQSETTNRVEFNDLAVLQC